MHCIEGVHALHSLLCMCLFLALPIVLIEHPQVPKRLLWLLFNTQSSCIFFALSKGVRYRFFPGNSSQWVTAPLASSYCIGSSTSMEKLGMHVMWKGLGNIVVYVYRIYMLQCLLICIGLLWERNLYRCLNLESMRLWFK